MEKVIAPFRTTVLALLKLKRQPPSLPEGSTLVRHVRPAAAWRASRYISQPFFILGLFAIILGPLLYEDRMHFAKWPPWPWLLGGLALIVLSSIFVALCTVHIDFDMRHYLVGDRSLRVIQNVWVRREVTISYANVQNISVVQSPWARLFGYKSLIISTAGSDTLKDKTSHLVTLLGLENANELRGLILGMLKQQKHSGLGEAATQDSMALDLGRLQEVRSAAIALREEARLRHRREGVRGGQHT